MRLLAFVAALALLAAQDKKKPEPKDAPRVLYSLPLVTASGFKGKITLRGLKLDDATDVKAPGAQVKLVGKPKKATVPKDYPLEKTGDTEAEVELDLPKDFAGDHLLLTVTNPKGTSEPFKLVVDGSPRMAEKEPNDSFSEAQELTLPTTVDGTFRHERDVDLYRFTGKAGEKYRVEVLAARLGAPTDAFLVVYDADKQIVATCDDTDGTIDPILDITLKRDGVYYVSVTEAHDAGGPMFAYWLRVAKGK